MGIFRITKGELKKIFLKPGIFVVTALLVVVLTLSALLFKPASRSGANVENVPGTTIGQMYDNSFASTKQSSTTKYTLSKIYLNENYITPSTDTISFYLSEIENETSTKKKELLDSIQKVKDCFVEYKKLDDTPPLDTTITDQKREELKKRIEEFQTLYTTYINGSNGFYYLLLDSQSKNDLDVFLTKCLSTPFAVNMPHSETIKVITIDLDMFITLTNYVEQMEIFLPSKQDIETAKNNLDDAKEKILEIENQIEQFKSEYGLEDKLDLKQEFKTLITRYAQASKNAKELTLLTINSSALQNFNDDYIQSLYQFENSTYKTKYAMNEQKNICKFYLDNNKYAFEYASPLSLSTTSNSEANVYDFMFFALELCSFIIVIYVVFLGATMIAGEYSNGTMKLLAIRPYSRRKILFGKLLATLFVGLIFLVLTFIVTYIIGAILYSTTSLPILMVFNSSAIYSVNPLVPILILFLCKTIEMIFYAIFALSISTWFKSNAGSVVVSLLLYFVSFILTMFTPSLGIIKYLPFVNTNLFGYFGSHLSQATTNNIFVNMFSRTIANDMNFFTSFAIITIFSVIIYTITSEIFAKRDIK